MLEPGWYVDSFGQTYIVRNDNTIKFFDNRAGRFYDLHGRTITEFVQWFRDNPDDSLHRLVIGDKVDVA